MFDPRQLLSNCSIYSSFRARLQKADSRAWVQADFLKIMPGQRGLDIRMWTGGYSGLSSFPTASTTMDTIPSRIISRSRAMPPTVRMVDDIGTFDVVIAPRVAISYRAPGTGFSEGSEPVARLLTTLDRGKYVRTPDLYLSIAHRNFQHVSTTVLHDLMAVPYTHCILKAQIPLQ